MLSEAGQNEWMDEIWITTNATARIVVRIAGPDLDRGVMGMVIWLGSEIVVDDRQSGEIETGVIRQHGIVGAVDVAKLLQKRCRGRLGNMIERRVLFNSHRAALLPNGTVASYPGPVGVLPFRSSVLRFPSFLINLSAIYSTAVLTSPYNHLPTLNSGNIPDIDSLIVAHNLLHQPAVDDIAPYFEGYFGEHRSNYPAGAEQLSGQLLIHVPKTRKTRQPRRHSAPYALSQSRVARSNHAYLEIDNHYPWVSSQPVAGPSRERLDHASISAPGPSPTETALARRRRTRSGTSVTFASWPMGTASRNGLGSDWSNSVSFLRKLVPVCKDTTIIM
ncbi:hypothetical protein B0H16DRAFT_1456953 [Mycena metata]|uniref:Uncharacterized protein n=1 Tax=Mycena metata TaxID=1033252 RepID=A0AAD7JBB4_9AGAR|nr:hypothetical protein B0H16DRAFT_1456953 [Mycena metata]